MDQIKRKQIIIFFSILIAVMAAAYIINVITASPTSPLKPVPEANPALYVTIRDHEGNVILETGRPVYENDEYISDTDIHYVIISVSGNEAVARVKEEQNPEEEKQNRSSQSASFMTSVPAQNLFPDNYRYMVVYHTHTDECYVPTSGIASRPGDGDVYEVGAAFSEALELGGISTNHSRNAHDPHDINAYHRSRRTALQLLKGRPDAAFDLHRDSAPRESYLTLVNGIVTGRVMIVIGRTNPHMKTNLAYAKKLKAKADELHPGLMRGIFLGRGDYNQDLSSRSLLLEVGTEETTLDEAQQAIRCLADSVIRVRY